MVALCQNSVLLSFFFSVFECSIECLFILYFYGKIISINLQRATYQLRYDLISDIKSGNIIIRNGT